MLSFKYCVVHRYCYDSDIFKRAVQMNGNKVEVYRLMVAIVKDGVKAKTYQYRAKTLSKFVKIVTISQNLKMMECERTIIEMYTKIGVDILNVECKRLNISVGNIIKM